MQQLIRENPDRGQEQTFLGQAKPIRNPLRGSREGGGDPPKIITERGGLRCYFHFCLRFLGGSPCNITGGSPPSERVVIEANVPEGRARSGDLRPHLVFCILCFIYCGLKHSMYSGVRCCLLLVGRKLHSDYERVSDRGSTSTMGCILNKNHCTKIQNNGKTLNCMKG